MILAAGLGTRLRPLTAELPKPLVPVGDRPALAHIAERLAAAGIVAAALNTHHLAAAFTPERLAGLPIALHVLHEPLVLGTAGGIANAAGILGEGDVVVWNGDILAEMDLTALLAAHAGHAAARPVATLAVTPRAVGEGTVGIGAGGRVVRLRGERFGDELEGGDFFGVQVVAAELRASFPIPGCLVDDGYRPALRRGQFVGTFQVATGWDDIGAIAAYLAANAHWLARTGQSAFVHPSARVAPGVAVVDSVIGAGAVVTGAGTVRGSVIWPGARAEAPLEGAVVTTSGVVARPGGS